jgi:predicted TIM-barrel fold metal-dependent hydrolase
MALIIDADAHFAEPLDLWQKYIEPKYRERAFRVELGETAGQGKIIVDRKVSALFPPEFFKDVIPLTVGFGRHERLSDPTFKYEDGIPAAYDAGERVKWLDAEGIDKQFIYPTWGLLWEGDIEDPELAAAHCRAYNNWLWEVCAPYTDRLVPIAHISLRDVEEAVRELRRIAKLGMKGVFIGSRPFEGRSFGHPTYDPFWAEAQELGLPVSVHVVVWADYMGSAWYKSGSASEVMYFSFMTRMDTRLAFTTMIYDGVFERFPRLKVVLVETQSGWLPEWLDGIDHRYKYLRQWSAMKCSANEYFRRQVWVSADPEERTLPSTVELLGEDKFFFGSDVPHAEGYENPLAEAQKHLKNLSQSAQRKILGENAAKVFGL